MVDFRPTAEAVVEKIWSERGLDESDESNSNYVKESVITALMQAYTIGRTEARVDEKDRCFKLIMAFLTRFPPKDVPWYEVQGVIDSIKCRDGK